MAQLVFVTSICILLAISAQCFDDTRSVKMSTIKSASASLVNAVVCPDGGECEDGQTCCLLASGRYGCCPYSSATCCSDKLHCCPNGFRCNLSSQTCER
ncbi:uncharacterized protein B4U80_10973 [Leptotrombidium deliense]|uniref:Granulins domain-containing protein n=1 Tax=Leptotrombidium deliense TaxID=299467 RepID=A0A443RTD6_9ACAR|nr:uncharacterized protein B4U80_10973 [Leptotrombidium deliense]